MDTAAEGRRRPEGRRGPGGSQVPAGTRAGNKGVAARTAG